MTNSRHPPTQEHRHAVAAGRISREAFRTVVAPQIAEDSVGADGAHGKHAIGLRRWGMH